MDPAPASNARCAFIALTGAVAGSALLNACGTSAGASSTIVADGASSASAGGAPSAAVDPIWGPSGVATAIIPSLQGISQTAFPACDSLVTAFGAQPLLIAGQVRNTTLTDTR
ncbi:hypothetical protein P3T23_003074 [Paraburkholderia sp. GAS448]|uniref:hypothetical protein n=1 Tax=Paraburkholderia sp. GAS448 TaxID=3035136 RepID=UPI003D1EE443